MLSKRNLADDEKIPLCEICVDPMNEFKLFVISNFLVKNSNTFWQIVFFSSIYIYIYVFMYLYICVGLH